MSFFQAQPVNPACDTCRARKVKCDRNDPCGNCQDANIICSRTPAAQRRAQNAPKRQRSVESDTPVYRNSKRSELEVRPSPTTHSASVPPSPSMIEAQEFIQRELVVGRHMDGNRKAVLESAMSFVSHLSQVSKPTGQREGPKISGTDIMDDITFPSMELLYWMLREMKGNSMGPYVLDYFKHVSRKSLKDLGLVLINREGDSLTRLLASICVNSIAFKFINTILSIDQLDGLDAGLRSCAENHRSSVQLAMARIQLLASPSLLFLQSLLCSAFISQGMGDSVSCWTFISSACKVCEDLGLEARLKSCLGQTQLSEDEQEMYYCFIWCHILDKNYSLMLGRSRCLLDNNGLDFVFSSTFQPIVSDLLSIYLHIVMIQGTFISELHPARILNNPSAMSRVEYIISNLLEKMEVVYNRIVELPGPSGSWDGLYMGSEIRTLEFSYHSLRTSILRSRQICSPGKPSIDRQCLESARMAMSALRDIQVEARSSIADIQAHVSFMHWTVLYHPLTPFFVLFCNVVASSDAKDFETLKLIASGLEGLTRLSTSIAKFQKLANAFIELCEGLVYATPQNVASTSSFGIEPELGSFSQAAPLLDHCNVEGSEQPQMPTTVGRALAPNFALEPVTNVMSEHFESAWGLFDAQPTLDWLDADFSFLDSNP